MSKELPFFKFYPAEWLIGKISFQTLEMQGAFIQCVCLVWNNKGSVKLNDVLYRVEQDKIDYLIKLGFINLDNDNRISIDFLNEQLNDFQKVREIRSIQGRAGGLAKAKQNVANANQTLPKAKQNVTDKIRKEKIRIDVTQSLEDVKNYFTANGFKEDVAIRAFNYYNENDWYDNKGNKVKNWKSKMNAVWFKEENKASLQNQNGGYSPKLMN